MDWLDVLGLGAVAYGAFRVGGFDGGASIFDSVSEAFDNSDPALPMADDLLSSGTSSGFDESRSSGSVSAFDDSLSAGSFSVFDVSPSSLSHGGLACMDTFPSINPANGLPMAGCLDIEGNPYGADFSHSFDHHCGSMFDY